MSNIDDPTIDNEQQPLETDLSPLEFQADPGEPNVLDQRLQLFNTWFYEQQLMAALAKQDVENASSLEVQKVGDDYEAFITGEKLLDHPRVGKGSTPQEAIKNWLEWNEE